jgi:hypothetical protein
MALKVLAVDDESVVNDHLVFNLSKVGYETLVAAYWIFDCVVSSADWAVPCSSTTDRGYVPAPGAV